MERKTKIRQIVQKIAVLLAVILALPQTPLAQRMGFGYVEAHADPVTEKLTPEISIGISLCGTTLKIFPCFSVSDGNPTPGGSINYEYKIVDFDDNGENNDPYLELASNVNVSQACSITVENTDMGKAILIRCSYSGDDNYSACSYENSEKCISMMRLVTPDMTYVSGV